jgi:hypothetical protein
MNTVFLTRLSIIILCVFSSQTLAKNSQHKTEVMELIPTEFTADLFSDINTKNVIMMEKMQDSDVVSN